MSVSMNNISNSQLRCPLVSFIIIMRNISSDTLSACIKSVLDLSLRKEEREIIVVDNGSDDFSPFSLGKLINDVIYLRMPSAGTETAMNLGLRVASGRYVQFMYATDKLLLDGYGHCIDLLRYKSPEIVIFNFDDNNSSGMLYDGDEMKDGAEYLRHNSIDSDPWGYVFSRNILAGLNFQEGNTCSYEEFTVLLFLRAESIASTTVAAYSRGERLGGKIDRKDKRNVIKRLDDKFTVICRLSDLSHSMPLEERLAIERRVALLTMDYIVCIVKYARSSSQLKARINRLEEKGLFPLPVRNYDKKYLLFSKFVKSRLLMNIAYRILGS